MSTARQVVNGAIKLLAVRPAESPLTDAELIDGLEAMNDMLNEWKDDGIYIDFETVDDLDETLYVDEGVIGAIKSNLAIYISPEYSDKGIPQWLAQRAIDSKKTVRAKRLEENLERSMYPDTLPVGSGNEWNNNVPDGDSAGNTLDSRFYPPNRRGKCS